MKKESTNVPTAKLRIKLLKHVIKYDVYPPNWFYLDDLHEYFMEGKITGEVYDAVIEKMLNDEDPSTTDLFGQVEIEQNK